MYDTQWDAASPTADGCFELYAQGTGFDEDLAIGQWSLGSGGQFGVRRGDSAGANTSTITRFLNISGSTQAVTLDVIVP